MRVIRTGIGILELALVVIALCNAGRVTPDKLFMFYVFIAVIGAKGILMILAGLLDKGDDESEESE